MSRNEVLEQIPSICDNSIIDRSAKSFSKQLLTEQAGFICKPILHDCYIEQFQRKILNTLKQHEIKWFLLFLL